MHLKYWPKKITKELALLKLRDSCKYGDSNLHFYRGDGEALTPLVE